MKRRCALLLTLLILLLIVGIPTGLLVREYRRERLNQDLIVAIKAEDTDRALAALRAGADVNCRDHSGEKTSSFSEHMKRLFDEVLHHNVNTEPDAHPPALLLYLDTSKDNPALVKVLLDAGANPNLTDSRTVSPVMWATPRTRIQTLRLLLQHGGNPNQADTNGRTALHYAANEGNAEATSLLLAAGGEINTQANHGQTPLYCACLNDSLEVTRLLLQHHANPNLRTKEGDTPLDKALFRESSLIIELRKSGAKTGKELDVQAANSTKR